MRPSELEGFWFTGRFSGKHGAVSVGSPSHSEAERARQWRALNFLQREHDGSHSVHSPHSSHWAGAEVKDYIKMVKPKAMGHLFDATRPKPASGRQGLDWIVGPGYSFVVFSTNKTMETNQNPWKTMKPPWKTMETNQKPWKTMKPPWTTMETNPKPWNYLKNSWKPTHAKKSG